MLRNNPPKVDLLILGAGWTATFLIPLLDNLNITYAATTTTGHDNTIPFKFDPDHGDVEPYKRLPSASTVLITFPLKGYGQSKLLTGLYRNAHGQYNNWIQLGATFIFTSPGWSTDDSDYNHEDVRAIAEDELMDAVGGVVLNLSGLWGGSRVPKNWLSRIANSKEDVRKRGCVHFVHGEDVARAIVAVHEKFGKEQEKEEMLEKRKGKRWIVSDMRTYDWYDLILSFSAIEEGEEISAQEKDRRANFAKWVGELVEEENVRALPRDAESFERRLDSRGFWQHHGIWPSHARLA